MSQWMYEGCQITVNKDGKFVADANEDELKSDTLDEIKRLIDKATAADLKKRAVKLAVLLVLGEKSPTERRPSLHQIGIADAVEWIPATITGFNRLSRDFTGFKVRDDRYIIDSVPDTDTNRKMISEIIEAQKRFSVLVDHFHKIRVGGMVPGYTTIKPERYDSVLTDLEERYAKALKITGARETHG